VSFPLLPQSYGALFKACGYKLSADFFIAQKFLKFIHKFIIGDFTGLSRKNLEDVRG